jgi:hypothetical protein
MFVADAEIDRISGVGDDITKAEADDRAAAFLVLFAAVGV